MVALRGKAQQGLLCAGLACWRRSLPVASFNDLVGLSEQSRRDSDVKELCSLHVDDEFEFRRLFDGQAGGIGTLENLVDVAYGTTVLVGEPRTIEHQEGPLGIALPEGRPWQLIVQREFYHL